MLIQNKIIMKKNNGYFYIAHLILLGFIVLVLHWTNYIQNEGFNPTDEGVIQAQSYRILNGEIPHKDFISIRPAFSGILHTIDFIIPLPLIESGRWMTVLETFIIAFFLSLIIRMIYFRQNNIKTQLLYLIPITLCTYILTTNVISIFPWTTIDALMFSSIALFFLVRSIQREDHFPYGMLLLSIMFFSIGALCRQTFVLTIPFIFIYLFIFKRRYKIKLFKLVIHVLIGCLPGIVYIIYIAANDALSLFVSQMTGRSEFVQTGIIAFAKGLAKSYLWPLYIMTLGFLFFSKKFTNKSINDKILNILLSLHFVGAIILCPLSCSGSIYFLRFWCYCIMN